MIITNLFLTKLNKYIILKVIIEIIGKVTHSIKMKKMKKS